MAFSHVRGVVHRGLEAHNMLVPDHPGSIDAKITDFGMSQLIDPKGDLSRGSMGTKFWIPELLGFSGSGKDQDTCRVEPKAADVYSFALTCYRCGATGRRSRDIRAIGSEVESDCRL